MLTRTRSPVDTLASSRNARAEPSRSMLRSGRSPVHIIVGALLVVALSLAFMWTQLRSDASVQVLAMARGVPAGQVIAAADLRVATVVPDPSVALVASTQAPTVVGRTASVPLVAGTLLSPGQLGPAAWPPPGQAVVALPVKQGRIPAGITPGARVQVLVVATVTGTDAGATATAPSEPTATVVDVSSEMDASGTRGGVAADALGRRRRRGRGRWRRRRSCYSGRLGDGGAGRGWIGERVAGGDDVRVGAGRGVAAPIGGAGGGRPGRRRPGGPLRRAGHARPGEPGCGHTPRVRIGSVAVSRAPVGCGCGCGGRARLRPAGPRGRDQTRRAATRTVRCGRHR